MTQSVKLAVLFATLVIDVFGIGIMLPVVPMLVRELTGDDIGSAAAVYGGLLALYSLMQFVFGPMMGALSDRFGRRPVLLISMLGFGIDYLLLAVAPNLWIVALARLLGGIMGASVATSTAYIADITPPEKRAQSFGLIGVAFGIGFVGGPLVGGVLGEFGSRVPFFAASGVSLLAAIFAFFLLPESLAKRHRRRFSFREANPLGAFAIISRYPTVVALLLVFVLLQLGERMLEANWVLYTAYRFGWTAAQVGVSLAVVGVLFAISQGGLVRVVVPRLGELRVIHIGLAIAAVAMTAIAFATQPWMIYVIVIPYTLGWALVGPAVQSLVTGAVPPTEQGILQGALTSASTLTGTIGPLLSGSLFSYFVGSSTPIHIPGIAYLVGAALFIAGLAFSWHSKVAEAVAAGRTLKPVPGTRMPHLPPAQEAVEEEEERRDEVA